MNRSGNGLTQAELSRLAALHTLGVVDQQRNHQLDALARLAAYVCGTPAAVVNLIDAGLQVSAAAYGCDPAAVSRLDSMCATSIQSRDVSYTADAMTDDRWSDNPFVSGHHGRIRLYAAAPLILPGGEVIGTVCAFSGQSQELTRVQLERLRDVADQVVLVLQLRDEAARLGHAATRDHLTGLPNRALFSEALAMALAKQERARTTPTVIFLDLDGFKAVNDTHGHAVGDELLRAVAQRLLEIVRATDLVARLAGDELVILTEPTDEAGDAAQAGEADKAGDADQAEEADKAGDADQAEEADGGALPLLARLREAFSTPFELSCGPLLASASVGYATAAPGDTPDSLLSRADAAMYEAKSRSGAPRR